MKFESYEQAVERTGRKWPYRTKDWPCPACGRADCDLDIDMEKYKNHGQWTFIYKHERIVFYLLLLGNLK